jgi:hypothetical protein
MVKAEVNVEGGHYNIASPRFMLHAGKVYWVDLDDPWIAPLFKPAEFLIAGRPLHGPALIRVTDPSRKAIRIPKPDPEDFQEPVTDLD